MADVRKWSYNDIMIKLNNLKKIIDPSYIDAEIRFAKKYTDDITDALNIAYYNLKHKYSNINVYNFGFPRQVQYKLKQRHNQSIWDKTWTSNTSSSWTISTYNGSYWFL